MSRHHRAKLSTRRYQAARAAALERAAYRCEVCGKVGRLECHHRTPLQRGGDPYALHNLQILCYLCHRELTVAMNGKPVAGADAWREELKRAFGSNSWNREPGRQSQSR